VYDKEFLATVLPTVLDASEKVFKATRRQGYSPGQLVECPLCHFSWKHGEGEFHHIECRRAPPGCRMSSVRR